MVFFAIFLNGISISLANSFNEFPVAPFTVSRQSIRVRAIDRVLSFDSVSRNGSRLGISLFQSS